MSIDGKFPCEIRIEANEWVCDDLMTMLAVFEKRVFQAIEVLYHSLRDFLGQNIRICFI